MRIPCPLCGDRPLEEFHYGGDASRKRPAPDATEEEWFAYVYLRDNPPGPHWEHWRHAGGCGAWLAIRRDTTSHRILSVGLARKGAE